MTLAEQVAFVQTVCPHSTVPCVKVAPNFAYNLAYNLTSVYPRSLVANGTAELILLSAQSADNVNNRCVWKPGHPLNGVNCADRFGPVNHT